MAANLTCPRERGNSKMKRKRVAVIEGEDASPEAVRPTVEMLDNMGLGIEWVFPAVGDRGKELYGSIFPEEARREIDTTDRDE